jgi:hypothetical protein
MFRKLIALNGTVARATVVLAKNRAKEKPSRNKRMVIRRSRANQPEIFTGLWTTAIGAGISEIRSTQTRL